MMEVPVKKLVFVVGLIMANQPFAHAAETMNLEFTKNAQSLFEKGIKQPDPLVTQAAYHWIGGNFEITVSYEVSVVNENLRCLKRLPLDNGDAFRVGVQDLKLTPTYSCSISLDVEKR